MTTLTLIGEPFPDWEADIQRSALADLTLALSQTAPRACGTRLLIARGRPEPDIPKANNEVVALPFAAAVLPVMWQSAPTARPLDGEFVHSLTPMIPLRSRASDDGTQTSVSVTHTIAWEAPELLGSRQARLYRAFVRRALKHADVVITPTYAVASVLQRRYGSDLPIQVLSLATPSELLEPADAAARRSELGLPQCYVATTATPTETGRLQWILDAMQANPAIPSLVVVAGQDASSSADSGRKNKPQAPASAAANTPPGEADVQSPAQPTANAEASQPPAELLAAIPEQLRGRVTVVQPRDLPDLGAIISGAELLLQPQALSGSGYLLHAALSARVPIVHSECAVAQEVSLDAGVSAANADEFAMHLGRLTSDDTARHSLEVLAGDRSRSFSWRGTAWQLWELHAAI